ncbi:MAG: FAD-dependent oxidoreductase [Acidobacteriota bacterium]|nr:FAD-dependent oxidoreductase [Acidobacteriota bacterium]
MHTITRRAAIASTIGAAACLSASLAGCNGSGNPGSTPTGGGGTGNAFDLVVFGATPGGILAGMAAARMGAKVALIEPTQHVGGAITSGLGITDSVYHAAIGGLTAQFYLDIAALYGNTSGTPQYNFEPHVAEALFLQYIEKYSIKLLKGAPVASVSKNGTRIQSATLSDSSVVQATQWVDASYEGDLMALAGVSYAVGRESSSQYGESLAGWGIQTALMPFAIDDSSGNPWPDTLPNPNETAGQADGMIMAYTFRTTMTTNPVILIPFPAPPNYNPDRYGLLQKFIQAAGISSVTELMSPQALPNQKYALLSDTNISADHAGANWTYPNASPTARLAIWQDHYNYVAGWLYFLANDISVPLSVRTGMSAYGLAADEYTDHGNWPWQMYVREARRLRGQYVMAQADMLTQTTKADSIARGMWNLDSHYCGVFGMTELWNGSMQTGIVFDGAYFEPVTQGYQIPYRSLVPNASEVSNLAVPVCVSASHVGYSALRVEPTYMTLGEVAGVAAGLALQNSVDLANVSVPNLQAKLTSYKCIF